MPDVSIGIADLLQIIGNLTVENAVLKRDLERLATTVPPPEPGAADEAPS